MADNDEVHGKFGQVFGKFDEVDRKFEGLDQKLNGIDQKFDRKFDEVYGRFDEVYSKFDEVDRKFEGVDQKLNGIDQKFGQKFDQVEVRLGRIDWQIHELRAESSANRELLNHKIDQTNIRIDKRADETIHQTRILLEKFREEIVFGFNLPTKITEHDKQLINHETRILKLENRGGSDE